MTEIKVMVCVKNISKVRNNPDMVVGELVSSEPKMISVEEARKVVVKSFKRLGFLPEDKHKTELSNEHIHIIRAITEAFYDEEKK